MEIKMEKMFTPARIKLILFFIKNKETSFSFTALVEKTDLSRASINDTLKELLKEDIILFIKKTKKSKEYMFNEDNFISQAFMDLEKSIKSMGEGQ